MDTNSVLEEFLRHLRLERGLSERSVETYSGRLKDYLRTLSAKGIQPELARREDVIAHLVGLKERGLEASSILCSTAAIRSFHRHLMERGRGSAYHTVWLILKRSTRHFPMATMICWTRSSWLCRQPTR